ncbi:MAG: lysylphosphatidylglycerol synthase domain-containing protein [Polyangiales bacterium]
MAGRRRGVVRARGCRVGAADRRRRPRARGLRDLPPSGRVAVATALLLTLGFFWARFSVAYFILLALGIPTTPRVFVAAGPPWIQVVLVQSLLNFALYLSPTPGASGIAEGGSNLLMSPWVDGAHELAYLVLWRVLALFLCMFVGGSYVFRYLGTDVLERRAREAEEAEREMTSGAAGAGVPRDEAP